MAVHWDVTSITPYDTGTNLKKTQLLLLWNTTTNPHRRDDKTILRAQGRVCTIILSGLAFIKININDVRGKSRDGEKRVLFIFSSPFSPPSFFFFIVLREKRKKKKTHFTTLAGQPREWQWKAKEKQYF